MDDITPDMLGSLISGDLPEGEAAALRRRAEGDPELAARIVALEDLAAFLRAEATLEVSPDAVEAAKRLLPESHPGVVDRLADRAAEGVRVILAALDFDSRLSESLAGFRGTADITQVAFSCEACQIDLEIHPAAPGRATVRAQIDADEAGAWSVAFRDSGGGLAGATQSDAGGGFRLELAEGVFTMALERGGVRVVAGPITIP